MPGRLVMLLYKETLQWPHSSAHMRSYKLSTAFSGSQNTIVVIMNGQNQYKVCSSSLKTALCKRPLSLDAFRRKLK